MAKLARCPSCGAPVEFKSVVSVLAVCDFCQSTLVRRGEDLENLGRMAELIEDRSPLQRGAEGRWQGVHFGLIGRIQLRWEQGLWNEWHLLFDDGRSGWLSEAGGEYVLSLPLRVAEPLPAFADIAIGQNHVVAGRNFSVTNILEAECVAGEGELPFKVGAGYPAPVVDLRDEAGAFATFDYSDDAAKPLVFVGERVDFASLAWANLRERPAVAEATVAARVLACPSCGAPFELKHAGIESYGCASCGAVLDPTGASARLIGKATAAIKSGKLPLGAKGTLRGREIEILGYMRRSMRVDGVSYGWDEYVGRDGAGALAWLTEYEGHWNLAATLGRAVRVAVGDAHFEGERFKHFQGYEARVDYVIGEFPWRVAIDERVRADDYVAPPRMLSREQSAGEETWTLAEYVGSEEVRAAFGIEHWLALPGGVFANQPNPWEETHARVCGRFWRLGGIALLVTLLLGLFGRGGNLIDQSVAFSPADEEPPLVRELNLPDGARRLQVRHDTDLGNNWAGFNITLANKDTGEAWQAYRELGYWSGVDGGESWSEGSRDDEVIFVDLPPGRYTVVDEAEMDAGGRPVRAQVRIGEPGLRWSSFILLMVLLAAFPIFTRVRRGAFEVKRWADSDHPIVTASDDGDDD